MRPEDRIDAITRRELVQLAGVASSTLLVTASSSASIPPVDTAPLPEGVHAEWALSTAYHETTPTQERVSLNGLWRWQPARPGVDSSAIPIAEWGWFKAPGSWPGITDYLHKDCQTLISHHTWQTTNFAQVTGAWYQRNFTVPPNWSGRRIALRLNYLNTFATCFIDAKPAGEIKFPAGELVITAHCSPGATHTLSLFVLAAPLKAVVLSYTDTNAAREVKGVVERRGLCGDAWLESSPAAARISNPTIETSVSRAEIKIQAQFDALTPGKRYQVKAEIFEANKRIFVTGERLITASDLKDGLFTFTQKWKPDKLWDTHTPQNQYSAVLVLSADNKIVDQAMPVRFGYREFSIIGRDFYLNGSRIYLHAVPFDNAQVGAAWASYEGARETLERFKSIGINFVYTHNYSSEPGTHLSFDEILRAADDVGILVALAQPHFSNYDWKAADADNSNGYAQHAQWYTRVAGSHPSVAAYAMSHNATGYIEEMNPDMIDGIQDPREDWGRNNARLAVRAEAIVKRFDASRIVYHHSSGNLGSMHTSNFYVNLVPSQELCDWFDHWQTKGVKPLFLCEYGVPCTWDWTMYRGWYKGRREWGSAEAPWEFCIAEWNAQYLGDTAYKITDREKANLRWEAAKFKAGQVWHRWDYPTEVGSAAFNDRNLVFAEYIEDNWRAYRTRGVSAFGPWEYEMFWTLKANADRSRKQLGVDWSKLQRPGFSADYVDDRVANLVLSYEREDWLPTPAGQALLRNNAPLLAYIGGQSASATDKGHNVRPGEKLQKQLIIVNNSRSTAKCDWSWKLGDAQGSSGSLTLPTGSQTSVRIDIAIPSESTAGKHSLDASVVFNSRETQRDTFALHVVKPYRADGVKSRIAVFDPSGETIKHLNGVAHTVVTAVDPLTNFDVLIVGKGAITRDGKCPDISGVNSGLKVLMLEQTAVTLEQRFGLRTAEYGMRKLFCRVPDHPALAGLDDERLRDWRGDATLVSPRLKYTIADRYSPQVRWCGLDETRAWRAGCRGNVASVVIEKPAIGDFTPIIDCGYGLQYCALLEYKQGQGMVMFCQTDVTGRTETDPAAELLLANLVSHVQKWKPTPRRQAYYVGGAGGREYCQAAGIHIKNLPVGGLPADALLIAAEGILTDPSAKGSELQQWVKQGGRVVAVALNQEEANAILNDTVEIRSAEHISTHFSAGNHSSWIAGVSPADVHNRDPRMVPLVTGGAVTVGNGVLAHHKTSNVVFSQLAPWQFDSKAPLNQKRTFRHLAFLTSRLMANQGAAIQTPLLSHISNAPGEADKRWLEGLYLDVPEEWDDPYRFFGW